MQALEQAKHFSRMSAPTSLCEPLPELPVSPLIMENQMEEKMENQMEKLLYIGLCRGL